MIEAKDQGKGEYTSVLGMAPPWGSRGEVKRWVYVNAISTHLSPPLTEPGKLGPRAVTPLPFSYWSIITIIDSESSLRGPLLLGAREPKTN